MTLRRQLRLVRDALPPADPASPEALSARLQALAAQEYAAATPATRLQIDTERAAAAEAYARDPEGHLASTLADLRAALAPCVAAAEAAGDLRP